MSEQNHDGTSDHSYDVEAFMVVGDEITKLADDVDEEGKKVFSYGPSSVVTGGQEWIAEIRKIKTDKRPKRQAEFLSLYEQRIHRRAAGEDAIAGVSSTDPIPPRRPGGTCESVRAWA